ncbi:hypothetical protein NPIL_452201 [Nephila pilipes]|uniref:Uncharacterized protein n=1 Tax=Nephila pilipes TaxID=299642 RepID=A0A8X6QC54_NEPPI|nr:hypothetical protein NPIL_452201 [Nephila pilipes]
MIAENSKFEISSFVTGNKSLILGETPEIGMLTLSFFQTQQICQIRCYTGAHAATVKDHEALLKVTTPVRNINNSSS